MVSFRRHIAQKLFEKNSRLGLLVYFITACSSMGDLIRNRFPSRCNLQTTKKFAETCEILVRLASTEDDGNILIYPHYGWDPVHLKINI